MTRNAGLEGVASALLPDGTALVRSADGKQIQARGVLPDERVAVGRVERRGGALRGFELTVLEASPSRVTPVCRHVDRCGGCALMHASAAFSDAFKLERVARLRTPSPIELVAPAARLAYRTRARLAFARRADGIDIGYRQAWGIELVDVDHCAVLSPPLDALLRALRERLGPHLVGKGELRLGVFGGLGTAYIESKDAQPTAVFSALGALVREGALAGAALLAGGASVPARFGVEVERTDDVDGRALDLPLGGFSQAHGVHNRALAEHVLEVADVSGKRVLELFAGHGNFSLPFAARASALTAVELDRGAVAHLRTNLARHSLAARVIEADAAVAVKSEARGSFDVMVLDPPREGAHQVARALPELAPARVVYVSCDPESLARDLEILSKNGFALDSVRAFDMFPQTAHVEVAAVLSRMPGARAVAAARAGR